jgi:hypothetical protein
VQNKIGEMIIAIRHPSHATKTSIEYAICSQMPAYLVIVAINHVAPDAASAVAATSAARVSWGGCAVIILFTLALDTQCQLLVLDQSSPE